MSVDQDRPTGCQEPCCQTRCAGWCGLPENSRVWPQGPADGAEPEPPAEAPLSNDELDAMFAYHFERLEGEGHE